MSAHRITSDIEWQDQAACVGTDPDVFFIERGDKERKFDAAKAICHTCPVIAECLEFALVENIQVGCWGGTSERERRRIRRQRRMGES